MERRNQYRRSEIRKCSKFKRKTVSNSTSFDSFNELAENAAREIPTTTTTENELTVAKEGKPLARTNSIDDNMLPALHKLAAVIKNKGKADEASAVKADNADSGSGKEVKQNTIAKEELTSCIMRDQRRSACASPKSPLFGLKALKERSKSVPRISFQCEDLDEENESLHGSNTNLDARKSKSSKSIEVKQYNHKTIPKRIATLKKQRTGKTKETSKFYMDLSEFDDAPKTELKITESTENLLEEKQAVTSSSAQKDAKTVTQNLDSIQMQLEKQCEELLTTLKKKDADIILDLLKQNKEFERIAKKKQQRKRTEQGASGSGSGSGSAPGSPESPDYLLLNELPPRPPSRSPPPLESECESAANDARQATPDEEDDAEPIYESLLRNVHVPYKFSPVLGRSVSTQQCKTRERKSPPAPRPESDYVTLVYSPEGALQKVGNEMLPERASSGEAQLRREPIDLPPLDQRDSSGSSTSSSTCTLKRDSQNTVINVECASASNISMISNNTSNSHTEAIYARPIPKNLMKRLFSTSAHTAIGMGSKSSHENISSSHNSLLPRARKSIDNIALSFGRSNKPPERRVSDVTEMCRQSILHRQGSEAVGERMAHVDYADPRTLFTVNVNTSSDASLQRDSVFSLTSSNDSVCDQKRAASSTLSSDASNSDFVYEDNVEACLENDFRDSAIYSDDNEKRADYESSDGIKRPSSPPPPPPPARNRSNPDVPPKPTGIPRVNISKVTSPRKELPAPSPLIGAEAQCFAGKPAHVVICPPHLSAAASRSWVLQQIDNFNK